MLVIDDESDRASALVRDIELLGLKSLHARTPLDALRWLEAADSDVAAVLVGIWFGRASGLDVIAFVAEYFPLVRRVLLTAELNPEFHQASRAHAVLLCPWDHNLLARAISPPPLERIGRRPLMT